MAKPKEKRERRGTIWSNLRWIHPERTGYGTGVQSLKEKLRYFTYRDDRDVKAPAGGRRWVDHGLGATHREILESCQALTSDDRLAWSVMLSPKPRLMALIEQATDRREFLENLTEEVVEQWFEARGYVDPLYSYVTHDRSTSEEGLQMLHTHIILPGTVETSAGRERFDNRPTDLREFNELVEDLFELHMDRWLGKEWRMQWAAIQREEYLKKYFQAMQGEALPANLPELAEQLYEQGFSVAQIPTHVTTVDTFNEWLVSLDRNKNSLDAWFGRETR
ncbi:MAG: hypothetical protein BroJett018_22170 [Chloroflexota bacterium]|nr:hypothetical protein [Chloroflexota bacterium]NOG66116.1 hypothetical protein [Chloroflexota bacterium]GIK64423.1 MAG: hypothetical protein BroJett018_22170 [Chloroflexota bacterium]